MKPTILDYEAYVAEYDKLVQEIENANGGVVPFDIAPKLNKAAFKFAFDIKAGEEEAKGIESLTSKQVAKEVAREGLYFTTEGQATRHLEMFEDPTRYAKLPDEIKALKGNITREDLLLGTENARRLTDFLAEEYKKFKLEDTGTEKGKGKRAKQKVSQLYFGS